MISNIRLFTVTYSNTTNCNSEATIWCQFHLKLKIWKCKHNTTHQSVFQLRSWWSVKCSHSTPTIWVRIHWSLQFKGTKMMLGNGPFLKIFLGLPAKKVLEYFSIFFRIFFFSLSLSLSLSPSLSSAVFNLSFSVAKVLNAAKLKWVKVTTTKTF